MEKKETKFIDINNVKELWQNISGTFVRMTYIKMLENRITKLEEAIKKISNMT